MKKYRMHNIAPQLWIKAPFVEDLNPTLTMRITFIDRFSYRVQIKIIHSLKIFGDLYTEVGYTIFFRDVTICWIDSSFQNKHLTFGKI